MSVTVDPAAEPGAAGLSKRRRILVLLICSMSLLLIGLDTTIVNVALPSIHRDLHASIPGLQWTIDAYTLVIASLLVLSGSTADRIGRRRVFRIGLTLFTLGSGLCAAAPSLELLIAARVLQAIGGSMLNPVALSIIRNVFTDPRERALALGIWSATIGISMGLGPVIGGALIVGAGWRLVFLVNVPIGIAALVLTTIYVPESRAEHPRAIDPVGQVLVIVGLFSLIYAIIEGHSHGWGSPEIIGLFALAALSVGVLIPYELRRAEPLIEMRFFRSVPFAGATVVAVTAFGSFGAFLFLNTLYLQDVLGLSAFQAGLATLPIAAVTVVLAPLSGRVVGRHGSRWPLLVAGTALTLSPLLLTGVGLHTPLGLVIVSYIVFGIGFGVVNPPITVTALAGMPSAQAGVAAAIASTSRQVGATLGIALAGALVSVGGGSHVVFGQKFADATHLGWWMIAGMGFTLLVIGILTTTRWAIATARHTAALLAPTGIVD